MGHFTVQYGPFHRVKWLILARNMAHFATQCGPACFAVRAQVAAKGLFMGFQFHFFLSVGRWK